MDSFLVWLEGTELAFQIGATWWFPLLESLHVLGLVVLLGSLLMVDLRLLGWSGTRYPAGAFAEGMLRWVWAGFGLALISGLGMFTSRPTHYADNPAFQIKLLLLAVLLANLLGYRLLGRIPPRLAAFASLWLWAGVVVAGRWTGHLN